METQSSMRCIRYSYPIRPLDGQPAIMRARHRTTEDRQSARDNLAIVIRASMALRNSAIPG